MEPIMITIPMKVLEDYMRKSAQLDAIVAYASSTEYGVDPDVIRSIACVKKEAEGGWQK